MDALTISEIIFFSLASIALTLFVVFLAILIYLQVKFYRKLTGIIDLARDRVGHFFSVFSFLRKMKTKNEDNFWQDIF